MNTKNKDIILASASPRRHELLTSVGIPHRVVTADADEGSVEYRGDISAYVGEVARLKNIALRTSPEVGESSIVISADTVVYLPDGDEILGKPKDRADAYRMLRSYSGRAHKVLTGVCIYDASTAREIIFTEVTDVYFRTLSDPEIDEYLSTPSPYDKAGAYGIQEGAAAFVSRIDGDYPNVVGLPACRLCVELASIIG